MAYEFFANNAVSTLAVTISDSSTEIQPADPSTFPAQSRFRIRIGSELMLVTAVVVIDGTLTKWYVDRGIEGTAPATHNSGTTIRVVVTAEALEALNGMPMGGATGQFLSKAGSDDYDTQWADIDLAGGGFTGVLPVANGGTGASTFTSQSLVVASSGVLTSAGQTVYASSGTILTLAAGSAGDKPLVLKGASGQTGNLLELQDSGGSSISTFDAAGNLMVNTTTNLACTTVACKESFTVGLAVLAQPYQTADIQRWYVNPLFYPTRIDSNGMFISSSGLKLEGGAFIQLTHGSAWEIRSQQPDSTSYCQIQCISNGDYMIRANALYGIGTIVGIGTEPLAGAKVSVKNNLPAYKAQVIQAASAQTANISEWQDSSGDVLSSVNKYGCFATRQTSAPPDADIATNEMTFWFDNSIGASKIKFKARDSAGTIVMGEVTFS